MERESEGKRIPARAAFLGLGAGLLLLIAPASAQVGCGEPKEEDFKRVTLLQGLQEPMEVEFTDDGRALIIEKVTGRVLLYKEAVTGTAIGTTVVAADLNVSIAGNHADGLLGLALDPAFAANHWVYLYYSPVDKIVNRVSRFVLVGDKLDLNSEKTVLEVPTHRRGCCHSAGGLEFGPGGNLYVSTGDNAGVTSGIVSKGAEVTSGNTNDLRGMILRVHPEADGGYTIPAGNLFPPGMEKTRPEIFTMGHRNPLRFSVDPVTGAVLSGDVGPDASTDFDELNYTRTAGNQGWPYFVGDINYMVNGKPADPSAPQNLSSTNTGLTALPPQRAPALQYRYDGTPHFPGFNRGGRVACAGPIYRYDGTSKSKVKLPPWFDGKWLVWDWIQRSIRAATIDAQGNVTAMTDLFPRQVARDTLARMTSIKIGPDGALYLLQYGWGTYAPTSVGGLIRMEYRRTECLPVSLRQPIDRPRLRPHDLPAWGREGRALDARGREVSAAPGRTPIWRR